MRIVICGVSGCGKTTVGQALASQLGCGFVDADDLHSAEAKAKMAGGTPLTDEDRWPWLDRVRQAMGQHGEVVVACSALKRSYRDRLRDGLDPLPVFVWLQVDRDELQRRLAARPGHFFDPKLLDDQLATFEQGNDLVTVSVDQALPSMVAAIQVKLMDARTESGR